MNNKDSQLIYESYRQDIVEEGLIDDIAQKGKQIGLSLALVTAILGAVKMGKMSQETHNEIEKEAIKLQITPDKIVDYLGLNNLPPLDGSVTLPPDPNAPPTVVPPPAGVDNNATNDDFFERLHQEEGWSMRMYNDTAGNPTIGVGHHLDGSREDRADVANALTNAGQPAVNYDRLLSGRDAITEDQGRAIFNVDLERHLTIARRYVPAFNNLPGYLQLALGDAAFRTDLQGSPDTVTLMNNNQWIEAAAEYINNDEYESSRRLGAGHGVWQRMNRNRDAFRRYGEHLARQQNNR